MADWLSFWNQKKRDEVAERTPGGPKAAPGDYLTSIYVPYGQGLIHSDDWIYCVGIENGKLLLISRLQAGAIKVSTAGDKQIDIEARDGTETELRLDRHLPREDAERIQFFGSGGGPSELGRSIQAGRFQGRASVRELIPPAAEILDAVIGPR